MSGSEPSLPPPLVAGFGIPDPNSIPQPPVGQQARPPELDWRTYLEAVLRYKWLVASITALGAGAGLVAAMLVPPTYQVEAAVWVETTRRASGDPGPIWATQLLGSSGWVELARSQVVLGHVVDSLRLFVRPAQAADAPAFASLARVEGTLRRGRYRLERLSESGNYGLRDESGLIVDQAPPGQPLGAPLGFRWIPPTGLRADQGKALEFELIGPYDAMRELLAGLQIRTDRDGSFLRLHLRGTDPVRLAAIVNVLAERLVSVAAELKRERLTALVGILGGQLATAQRNLDARERALTSFRERSATVLTTAATPAVPGIGVTSDPLFAAYLESRVSRDQLRADREAIERALRSGSAGPAVMQALELVGSVQRATGLLTAIHDVTAKYAEQRTLLARYTDEHPAVQRLIQDIATLEQATIPTLARDLVAELRTREDLLGRQVESASSALRRISPLAVEEARLQREVTIGEELFASLRQRYEEVRLSEVSTIPDLRVLDVARAPSRPLTHLAPVIVLLGLIAGGGAGVGLAVVRQSLDRTVRLPTEVAAGFGIRILGVVPHVSDRPNRLSRDAESAPVVEALRVIRLNVMNAYGSAGPIVFTITSAGGGEGKSFIACNLALSFAAVGHRTLLIDADTRRGALHRLLGVARKPGLVDHVSGHMPLENVLQATRFPGLHFVGCGSRSRAAPELLMSAAPARFLMQLRMDHDVIIVDSPPLAAGVDPFALATLTGNALFVVRTGVTDRQVASAKLEVLKHLPVRILGAVLNGARMTGAYGYYAYSLPGYENQDEEEVRGTHGPSILRG